MAFRFLAPRSLPIALALAAALAAPARAASPSASPRATSSSSSPLWPLAEKTCVSGTFGEYRDGHFHAGIDLSTGGRIGLPVRAVGAGRVVRLRASPYGYGRAIYIDIEGARQVVYGHLSSFAPRWQALVEAEQERLGKYTVDFAVPDSARVAAGEVVAYTGDSGGGGPHLHFEVRESDTDPINPLTHGWEAEDRTPPVIRAIRLVPLGLEGRVDGGLDPVVVRVTRSAKDGVYRAGREPAVSGPVGVQVLAADRAGRCDDAREIFGASVSIDDSVLFETEFQSVSYLTDWDEVDVLYDAAARADGLGNFVRLYEPVGWAGALREEAIGAHRVSVAVRDATGNEAGCGFGVTVASQVGVPPTAESVARSESLPTADPDEFGSWRIDWRLVPEGVVIRVGSLTRESRPIGAPARVRILGTEAPISRAAATPAAEWFVVSTEQVQGSQVLVEVQEYSRYFSWSNASYRIGPFVRGMPGVATEIKTNSAHARLRVPANALFSEALLAATPPPKYLIMDRNLIRRADAADFLPPDLLLREKVEVRFAVPDSLRPRAERLGVYSVEPGGSKERLGGTFDPETGEIVAKTGALGTFLLLEDASRPRLSRPRPADGATTSNTRPRLLIRVAETGEGLDDEGIRFTIDGERLIPEYDPDAGHIVARPKRPLARGAHRVEVRLADKAGNEATTSWRFTVTGQKKR